MPVAASIEMDAKAVAGLFAAINRNAKDTGRSARSSLAWGGWHLTRSLGGQTKRSKKLRKVVDNPLYNRDQRRAQFGVWRFRQDKPVKFMPIAGTGEFGLIRFKSRTTGEILTRDRLTGEIRRFMYDNAEDEKAGLSVMKSPKRKIGRRGFAARSWQFLRMRVNRGGSIFIKGIPNMGEVVWSGGAQDPAVTINNRVSYMEKALSGGSSAISNAMRAATSEMMHKLDKNIRKKMGV